MQKLSREDKRAAILDAADTLFGGRGFAGVSMRDVAQEAGLNKALLFYYFGGKDALFEAVLQRYYAAHREVLAAAFAAEGPTSERLHRGIDAYLDFIEANQRYPRLVQSVVTSSPEHHPLVEQNLTALFTFVAQAVRDIAPESGPQSARHLFVTLSGAVVNYFTYAGVLDEIWDADPMSEAGLAERRTHIHWLVQTLLDALAAAPEP